MKRSEYNAVHAMNFSTLIHGRKSMAHLKWAIDNPREQTDAMLLGCAWHLALFEPADFDKRIFIFHGKKRIGAEWDECEKLASDAKGYALIEAQYESVIGMRDAVTRNAQARALLKSEGKGEFAIKWADAESEVECKGMLDRLCKIDYGGILQPWIIDGKTCGDCHPKALKYTVEDYGYHVQAAMYLDGANAMSGQIIDRRFAWIFQEKTPPYDTVVYEASDNQISEGRRIYKDLLKKYVECKKTNVWPGRQNLSEIDALEQM